MLYLQHLILFALPAFLLCSATRVLPRAQHAAAESEALIEIRSVMLGARTHLGARNAPIHRRWLQGSAPVRDATNESPSILDTRQFTCDPGYGICDCECLCLQPPESQVRRCTDSRSKRPFAAPMIADAATTEPAHRLARPVAAAAAYAM